MFISLEMVVNTVCTLKIDGKHDLLTIFSSRGQKQNSTKPLTPRAKVADNVSLLLLVTSLKSGDVTNQ